MTDGDSRHYVKIFPQVLLALCLCMAILSGCSAPVTSIDDLVMEKDPRQLVSMPEQDVVGFFESHQSMMESLSTYMLANEKLFGTRPFSIGKGHPEQVKKLQDADMESTAAILVEQGIFAGVWSLNDDPAKSVHFIVDSESGSFEQGIRYVSDPGMLDQDRAYAPYNQVRYVKDLGSGWYYYLNYFNDIKNSEEYRKAAWEDLGEKGRQGILHDWSKAHLEIRAWDKAVSGIFRKDEGNGKPCDYVVAVIFRTDQDSLLGPVVVYMNPYTKDVIGYALRY